jgi:uncharacterized MnhB-related membrane protein
MLTVVLSLMVVFAIASIQAESLRHSVIYLAVFSLLCSFAYALYQAPDVAMAEAVIGCTLSTVLYLVAIKKYRVFRVYYSNQVTVLEQLPESHELKNNLIALMDGYLSEHELELEIVQTKHLFDEIHGHNDYDVIIEHTDHGIRMYGAQSNYLYDGLTSYLIAHNAFDIEYEYILEEDGEDYL